MMLGAVGALLGYVSLAYSPNVFFAYLGFGFFGGAAAGFVYATCVNMVGKWYPERKGGKTGFVNGGFAYGSVPFIFLFTSYLDVSNYKGLLFAVGVFLAALVAVSGFFFKDPPKNWWPAHVDPLKVSDDPRIRRALREESAGGEAVHADGGRQDRHPSADVVRPALHRRHQHLRHRHAGALRQGDGLRRWDRGDSR